MNSKRKLQNFCFKTKIQKKVRIQTKVKENIYFFNFHDKKLKLLHLKTLYDLKKSIFNALK